MPFVVVFQIFQECIRVRIVKAHPDEFATLRNEYAAIPHIKIVKDIKLHELLVRFPDIPFKNFKI